MSVELGLDDRLRVYVEASKRQFISARDTSAAAVQAMSAVVHDRGMNKSENVAAELLDEANTKLAEAALAARLMAATLEENRRMLLEVRRGLDPGDIQPE